jgi:hypothetical protein
MMSRLLLASVSIALMFITLAPATAGAAGPAGTEAPFRKLEIESAQFTHEQVGILHLELEKVANFLGLYVYKTFAKEILEGKTESRLRARRYLSLALQIDPDNLVALRINQMLAGGVAEQLEADLPQSPKLFAGSAVRLIKLLKGRPEPNAARLAGFLALVAADLDPMNEDAVYDAELFANKVGDLSAAWKILALGHPPAR